MADLFYIMGPSGAGKDSVLSYARRYLSCAAPVAFAHRYITRPPDNGSENHVSLYEQEFSCRLDNGLLAMHWQSHGLSYGIGVEIEQWLAQGVNVVVNGSRAYLPEAAAKYRELRPVLIAVPDAVLRVRLEQRGRENAEQIDKRLLRGREFCRITHPRLVVLDNSGPLAEAGERFLELLSPPSPCS